MNDKNYLDKLKQKRADKAKKAEDDGRTGQIVSAVNARPSTQDVNIQNKDLAKKEDIDAVIEQLKEVQLAALLGGQKPSIIMADSTDLGEKIATLNEKMDSLISNTKPNTTGAEGLKTLASKMDAVGKAIAGIKSDPAIVSALDTLNTSVTNIDTKPTINVPAPKVSVTAEKPDLTPLTDLLDQVLKAVKGIKLPTQSNDDVTSAVLAVQNSIDSLRFPVSNYLLPFKTADGKDTQVVLDGSGNIPISGAGTQYTDGGTPPAHPIGNAQELNVGGTWLTETGTNVNGTTPSANVFVMNATAGSPLGRVVLTNNNNNAQAEVNSASGLHTTLYDSFGNEKGNSVNPVFTSSPSDLAPATQNITVIDSGSATAAGANNQTIIIGNPTAGSAASFALSTIETIRVEVTGIWTGTIATETSVDGGTTWVNQGVHQGAYTTSSFTAGFVGGCNVAGATNFRIRATAAITGTVVVKVVESVNTQSVYIANAAPAGNVISVLNSSSATLTSGSVYTGTGEDVSNFSEMRISVFSNVASATDGFSIQQSTDNSNWDITDVYSISAATAKTVVVPRQARWFRVVYTNGGTNQATFRLQSILNRTATAPSSQRATDGYTNETDLVQNQTFPMLLNGSGTWDRTKSIATGIQGVGINDGVFTANVLQPGTGIAGANALMMAGTYLEKAGLSTASVTNNNLQASIDVSNYKSYALQLSGTWTGLVAVQGSNDNVTFVSVGDNFDVTNISGPFQNMSANGQYAGSVRFRYLRVRVVTGATGTINGVLELYALDSKALINQFAAVQSGTWTVGSNSATGATVPANAFYIGGNLSGSGTLAAPNTQNFSTDGNSNADVGLKTQSGNYLYNSSSWDRARSATASNGTTGTGLPGMNPQVWNGAAYVRVQGPGGLGYVNTDANAGAESVMGYMYNGASSDAMRNNTTGALIAAGTTSTQTNISLTTYNASKLVIIVNLTAGAGSVIVAINGFSSSSYSYNLLTSTSLTGTTTTALRIFPGATASPNAVANDMVPRVVRVTATVTGTLTYGVDYELSV